MYHEYILDQVEEQKGEVSVAAQTEEENVGSSDNEKKEEEESWPHSKIRFDLDGVKFFEVKARTMITSAERRAIWYQPIDFSKMSSMNRSSIKILRENPDERDHCARGLEHKLNGESDHINDIKVNSIFSVLKEQSRQRKSNTTDPLRISQIYKEHVFASEQKARELGFSDEKSAKEEEFAEKVERRRSFGAFDDFDLKELQDLDLHDDMDRFEWRMSEVQAPTEIYEKKNEEKEARKKLRQKIRRSLSPKRDPPTTKRGVSPKPGKSSDLEEQSPMMSPRSLSGKLSRLIRGASSKSPTPKRNREKSPKPFQKQSSVSLRGSKRPELPLPGHRNTKPASKPEKTGMRKIRSDMF